MNTKYDDILLSINSRLELEIFRSIRANIKKDFRTIFNQRILADALSCSIASVSLFVKKLRDKGFLKKIQGTYYANPFVLIPQGTPQEKTESFKDIWNAQETKRIQC